MHIVKFLQVTFLYVMITYSTLSLCQDDQSNYLYPIAAINIDNTPHLYVIHQQGPEHVALWLWNPQTNQATAVLSGLYTPAHVQPLPKGFSFIEHGMLRIKQFIKRSARTVEFSEPLTSVNYVRWLDTQHGYCCAKKRGRYGIFSITLDGDVTPLMTSMTSDYLWPTLIDNKLFCIERSDHENGFQYDVLYDGSVIALFGDRPIMALTMIDAHRALVVEYPQHIDGTMRQIPCACHMISCDQHVWQSRPLFTFNVPLDLVVQESPTHLHELIAPLMPRVYEDVVYFVDSDGQTSMNIFMYDLHTGCRTQKTSLSDGNFCTVPLLVGGKLWYGGSVDQESVPTVVDDEVCLKVPCLIW